jgi:hypothetical protein
VGLKGVPQTAETVGMKLRRSLFVLLLLNGVLAVTPAYAGTANDPRCHIEWESGERFYMPNPATFIVHSPGPRGAVGVWKNSSGDRVGVRVDPGEGEASKRLKTVGRHEYKLVRCETVR